jgi:FkbM family methyltransferase
MSIAHCRYGDFSIPDQSDLIFDALRLYGEWAQKEIDLLSRLIKPGAVIIDAGAFIGTHARAFSEMIGEKGRVHAFEPNPASYALLLENSQLAEYSNISTYQTALDEKQSNGNLRMDSSDENLGGTVLSGNDFDSSGIEICMRRLDNFDFGKVDFIKADIEGMEHSMLLGAIETVKRDRPVIFLEVNDLQASLPILGWARNMDYVVLGVLSEAYNNSNFNGVAKNVFDDAVECGLLLIDKGQLPEHQASLIGLDYHVIDTADNLAIFLRCKPQYLNDAMERGLISKSLGAEFNSLYFRGSEGAQLRTRLAATEKAMAFAESLALDRHDELKVLSKQLERTEKAKNKAEKLAHSNSSEGMRLQAQLAATEEAKSRAEVLAHSRSSEVIRLQAQLAATEEAKTSAEVLAHSHSSEVIRLQAQLAATEEAKSSAEAFVLSHDSEVMRLQAQLAATEEAKTKAEEFAHSHNSEVMRLQAQLAATEEAKTRAEEFAHSHSSEVIRLQAQLAATEEANRLVGMLAAERNAELETIRSSMGYRLSTALKLTPGRKNENV